MKAQTSDHPIDLVKRLAGCAFVETTLSFRIQKKFVSARRIEAYGRKSGNMITIGFMQPHKEGTEICLFTHDHDRVDIGTSPKSFGLMKTEIANTMLVL